MIFIIPSYLDDFIFNQLDGKYKKGGDLDNTVHYDFNQLEEYIGTYFPRSFAESYIIFREILSFEKIKEAFITKAELNVLDIGAGTGGNLLGLCHALKDTNLFDKKINIYTIEGNKWAILYHKTFLERFLVEYPSNIEMKTFEIHFNSKNDFFNQMLSFLQDQNKVFDIIMSFKFFCEFYFTNYSSSIGLYKGIPELIDQYLDRNGLLLLLDVVSGNRNHTTNYMSIILGKEMNEYVQSSVACLKYIIPLSCALWYLQCKNKCCYTERNFVISHSRNQRDVSKVTHRLLGKNELVRKILNEINKEDESLVSG